MAKKASTTPSDSQQVEQFMTALTQHPLLEEIEALNQPKKSLRTS